MDLKKIREEFRLLYVPKPYYKLKEKYSEDEAWEILLQKLKKSECLREKLRKHNL